MPRAIKQVTAAATATPLLDRSKARTGYRLHNASDAIIYIGTSNQVTTITGYAIGVNITEVFHDCLGDDVEMPLWCISTAGGKIVTVLEEF